MFSGFTSRCTTPARCAKSSAVADLSRDAQGLADGQASLAFEPLAQRSTRDVGGDVIEHPVHLARVDQGHEVRVRQARGEGDLALEALDADRREQFGAENLHRHLPAVLSLLGQVDRCHPARPDLALDDVSIGDGGVGEQGEQIGPARRVPWDRRMRGHHVG
jgi:hypothetical protein